MFGIKKKLEEIWLIVISVFIIILLWIILFLLGIPNYINEYNLSIYGSIIQGMSALLSVALAAIIFRIQTLENRRLSLERSVRDYIFQITQITYPEWIPSIEEDIRKGVLVGRYHQSRQQFVWESEQNPQRRNEKLEALKKDSQEQQKRLEDTLTKRDSIANIIAKIKSHFIISFIFLLTPILLSLLMLMIPQVFHPIFSFMIVSITILLSAIGSISLIYVVLESTIE